MTRKKLEEYRQHTKRIEYLERRLDYENQPTRDKVRGSSDMHPFAPRSFTIGGIARVYNEQDRLRKEIKAEKEKAEAVREEIKAWAGTLGEVDRDIILMVFIECKGFREVGDIVGYCASNICAIIKKLTK